MKIVITFDNIKIVKQKKSINKNVLKSLKI